MEKAMKTAFGFTRSDFPKEFRFGIATSSYQIEGSSFGGCGMSHWDTFAATPGNTARGENGAIACDHYHRWATDLDLVRDANLDAYRFSLSWSRILPEGRGKPNPDGIAFYDRLIDGMLERGIEPWATLYHWELPATLADLGGWRNRDIASWFADYASLVAGHFGDRLHSAAPINEPWCVAWLSHFMGLHAPGLRDIRATARAMHHVMLAHGSAIGAMRAGGMKNLGGVFNFEYALPVDETPAASAAATLYDAIYNRWFLEAVFRKEYPAEVLSGLAPYMPEGFEKDFDTIAAPLDWCGINYYTRKLIGPDGSSQWPAIREFEGPLEKTTMGWEIAPDGLFHFLTWIDAQYTRGMPVYVTENGMSAHDQVRKGACPDPHRIEYVERHLAEIRRAIALGVPVRGYVLWSLLDNFEWSLGYEKRFGLVHVDFETLERTPKQSWHALKAALSV